MLFASCWRFENLIAMWNQSNIWSACGATCWWIARRPASPSVRTVTEVDSSTPHRRKARPTELTASEPPLRTKAKRVACPSPSNALPATTSKFRSGRWCRFLTYPPSKPTTSCLQGPPDAAAARSSADFLSRLPTFIVRLRTVLAVDCADKGRSSPRKSVTFRNGNRAAILAVRYRNSGVMGLLFVNSVEKLCANDPEQGHRSEE